MTLEQLIKELTDTYPLDIEVVCGDTFCGELTREMSIEGEHYKTEDGKLYIGA